VNIKLYVWVRDNVHDLSPPAKYALREVASHVAQDQETTAISVATIARGMSTHWATARRALREATAAGYLAVDKSASNTTATVWRVLTAQPARAQPARSGPARFANCARADRAPIGLKDGSKEGGGAARARHPTSGAAVEKPAARSFAEVQAEDDRRRAERDAAVAKLIDADELARLNGSVAPAPAKPGRRSPAAAMSTAPDRKRGLERHTEPEKGT
jgi:hypothetical protein